MSLKFQEDQLFPIRKNEKRKILMRAYELRPDQLRWEKQNSIEAIHAQKLPGIRCPICGTWTTTGIIYPTVDVSLLSEKATIVRSRPLLVDQFNALALSIQPILGMDKPVMPGAELGPLQGKAKGCFGDFAWVNSWTPLLRESILRALAKNEIALTGVLAELYFEKSPQGTYMELEALPTVILSNSPDQTTCSVCGRVTVRKSDEITIDSASFDPTVPLQRIREFPTTLIANEPLARFIQESNFSDVILVPIEVR